jgi:signal transduction histidine kinase
MLEQINELLDLAHIQAGQPLMLMRVHVDLVELTTEVVGLYQQTQDLNKLHIEAAAPALTGYWDAVRIRRVISNLVSNALKYSPGNRPVILRLEQHDAMGMWATLEIRDEGIGIPAADLPYVFQPFHRAANVARHIPGSGLGLASARWIVEQHGGTLSVTSEVGVGTNFILRLPMDKVKLG